MRIGAAIRWRYQIAAKAVFADLGRYSEHDKTKTLHGPIAGVGTSTQEKRSTAKKHNNAGVRALRPIELVITGRPITHKQKIKG